MISQAHKKELLAQRKVLEQEEEYSRDIQKIKQKQQQTDMAF